MAESASESTGSKEQKTTKSSKRSKKVYISVDNTIEDVVQSENEGASIYFESDLGKFMELPEEVVTSLSKGNQARYFTSYYLWRKALEMEKAPATPGIQIDGRYARASARLEVGGRKPGMHYAWIDPPTGRVKERYEGYEFASDENLQTVDKSASGIPVIHGRDGREELVLMVTSEENFEKSQRPAREKSKSRAAGEEDRAMRELGPTAFKPGEMEKRRGHHPPPKFSPPILDPDE